MTPIQDSKISTLAACRLNVDGDVDVRNLAPKYPKERLSLYQPVNDLRFWGGPSHCSTSGSGALCDDVG